MDTNISDLVSDELRSVRKKVNQVIELLRYFVRPESSTVYDSLLKAGAALEAAEATSAAPQSKNFATARSASRLRAHFGQPLESRSIRRPQSRQGAVFKRRLSSGPVG